MKRLLGVVAILGLALALVAAGGAVLAGLGTRWDWWHFSVGFQWLRRSAQLGLGAAAVALVGVLLGGITRRWGSLAIAILGLGIGVTVVGVPWLQWRHARTVPAIHDITTDTEAPPAFVAVLPLRQDAPNSAEYGGPRVADQQKQGYPDIRPVTFAVAPTRVFEAVEAEAGRLGWQIVASVPAEGRLEAIATTFWFGFKDDVVVRVAAVEGGSRVDVRSVSRVGRSDIGANAARIRTFIQGLRDRGLPVLRHDRIRLGS